jgi:hypothetical protein
MTRFPFKRYKILFFFSKLLSSFCDFVSRQIIEKPIKTLSKENSHFCAISKSLSKVFLTKLFVFTFFELKEI